MNNNYNKTAVFYCKNCLGIAIKCDDAKEPAEEGKSSDEFKYCADCGGVSIGIMNFYKWEQLYKDTHGLSYLEDVNV